MAHGPDATHLCCMGLCSLSVPMEPKDLQRSGCGREHLPLIDGHIAVLKKFSYNFLGSNLGFGVFFFMDEKAGQFICRFIFNLFFPIVT